MKHIKKTANQPRPPIILLPGSNGKPLEIPIGGSLELLAWGDLGLFAWRNKKQELKKRSS